MPACLSGSASCQPLSHASRPLTITYSEARCTRRPAVSIRSTSQCFVCANVSSQLRICFRFPPPVCLPSSTVSIFVVSGPFTHAEQRLPFLARFWQKLLVLHDSPILSRPFRFQPQRSASHCRTCLLVLPTFATRACHSDLRPADISLHSKPVFPCRHTLARPIHQFSLSLLLSPLVNIPCAPPNTTPRSGDSNGDDNDFD